MTKLADVDHKDERNGTLAADIGESDTREKDDKYDQDKKDAFQTKIFVYRNSVLTDLMTLNHLKTLHNISIAIFILLVLTASVYYIVGPEEFARDSSLLAYGTGRMKWFPLIWCGLHVCIYGLFQTFSLWVILRKNYFQKVIDIIFLFMYINYLILTIIIPAYIVLVNRIPPITTFIILGEQLRLWMKTYSYVRENVPKVVNARNQKDGNRQFKPNIKHFTYFLFAPTLLYKDSYPRTQDIRWSVVIWNLFQMLCCIFINFCTFSNFTSVIFSKACIRTFKPAEVVLVFAGSMFVGSLMLFVMFYGFLHCWLNAFAEMLRFGDRQFYQDWWNSTSFSQYYRKWNGVVYDWLYAYIHTDIYKLTGNRTFSLVTVFLTSAIFHEYIMALGFEFFYPVLCIVYSTVGVMFVFLTNKKRSQQWNIFMYVMLFSGWGVLVFLYSFEWYARANTPRQKEGMLDYFVPRSWSCQIIDY